jgi:hypothetical protein
MPIINDHNPFLKALKEKSESTEKDTTNVTSVVSGNGSPLDTPRIADFKISRENIAAEWFEQAEESKVFPAITIEKIREMEDSLKSQEAIKAVMAKSILNSSPITGSIAQSYGNYGTTNNGHSTATQLQRDLEDFKAWAKVVNERLGILVPNPKLLEKYDALREAYEHYKTLEALLIQESLIDTK